MNPPLDRGGGDIKGYMIQLTPKDLCGYCSRLAEKFPTKQMCEDDPNPANVWIFDTTTCKWNVVWQEHYIFAWICYFLFFLILKIDDAPHVDATVNHLEWIEEHNRYRKQPQMDSTPFWSIPTISSKLWVLNKHPLPGVNGFLNWLLNYKNINQFLFEIINLSIFLYVSF